VREIDPSSGNAPYIEIANIVRDAIGDGEYEDGEQLPSRTELADRFSVSPMTVQNAMRILREEGVVATVPGKGVFARRGTAEPSIRAEIAAIKARLDRLEQHLT